MPARLLLLCLLPSSSWLTVEAAVTSPPECCIAGADGQPWPYRSAWAGGVPTRNSRRLVARLPSSRVDAVVSRRRRDGSPVPFRSGRRKLPSWDRWPPGVRIAHTARPVAGDVLVVRHDFRNPEIEKLGAGLAGVASLVRSGTVKRPDEALVGSRIRQKQHCDDLFRDARRAVLSRRRGQRHEHRPDTHARALPEAGHHIAGGGRGP